MFTKIYEKVKNFIKNEYKFILILIFIVLFTNLRLPYVIEAPGGAIGLEKRVELETSYKTEGSFNMAYVTMIKGTPMSLLFGLIRSDWDIHSYEDFTIGNENYEDSLNRDKLYLQQAISNASIAAFRSANKKIDIIDAKNYVVYIDERANTTLKNNDIIKAVDDIPVMNLDEMKDIIKDYNEDDIVIFDIIRDGKEDTATAKLFKTDSGLKVGIITITEYVYESDPKVKVNFKESESGSSGGLMTALEIYNRLVEEDLTKGRMIIGTGEIDINGNVGEIGGVKYKLAGAVKKKASIFLCPMENYEEAIAVKEKFKYNIEVIGVKTLEEAINALKG